MLTLASMAASELGGLIANLLLHQCSIAIKWSEEDDVGLQLKIIFHAVL